MPNSARIVDGSIDFSGGIDSGRVTTLASTSNPHGLKRNQTAWMTNCTCRGGGLLQRHGWVDYGWVHDGSALYQGGKMYDPPTGNPYIVCSIGGRIYAIRVDTDNSVVDITGASGNDNPPALSRSYFAQGEEFLIIQAGDGVTLPLFYDGTTMRRSTGFLGSPRELPAATAMDYFMGRLWYAQNNTFCAGDIVKGPSGTAAYALRDSILRCTENPLAIGGDGFTLPAEAGIIRGIAHTSELDSTLGEGKLYIGTRSTIFKGNIPVTRDDWKVAREPLIVVAQTNYGFLNDWSIVPVNADLFYQSMDGIRSLILSTRYFQQWGNTPISRNVNRALQYNDRSLMRFCSGVQFDNRMLQLCLPKATAVGAAFQGILPLDFDTITSLGEKLPPAWEGYYEGYDWLQLFVGDFGGRERCFGLALGRLDGKIHLVELTNYETSDGNDNRVTWGFETPAYTWEREFTLKELESLEVWIDKLWGTVRFNVEYRPDSDPCWHPWHQWILCSARNSCENVVNPVCYPIDTYSENYRSMVRLPRPPIDCASNNIRPTNIGYQFQLRFTIKGWCRIRGFLLHALVREDDPFSNLECYAPFEPVTNTTAGADTVIAEE